MSDEIWDAACREPALPRKGTADGERHLRARRHFELRMEQGERPIIYPLNRLAGGEYLSVFTEIAWREFLAGWMAANGRED